MAIFQQLLTNPRRRLALTTCLALYLELVMIRWLTSEIWIFAFLKNIPLIVCFMGLGLGMILPFKVNNKNRLIYWVAGLAILISLAPLTGISTWQLPTTQDTWIWWASYQFAGSAVRANIWQWWWHWVRYVGVIVIYLSVLFKVFVGIGGLIKESLEKLKALEGYRFDLAGSLAGVILFTLMAFLQLSPTWWIIISLVLLSLLVRPANPKELAMICIALVVTILSVQKTSWSPYYRVAVSEYHEPTIAEGGAMWLLDVNHAFFQDFGNHKAEFIAKYPGSLLKRKADSYDLPYKLIKQPGRVLVVGAGTGNDVAAALRHGATSVDAVEIDPVIAGVGRAMHPNRPYQDPKVRVIVDDARSWFEKTDQKYDTIVYGLLDAHTSVSSFSNVRLDTFVYTQESFQAAERLLNPDGNLILNFAAGKPWIIDRLSTMLTEIFGQVPLAFNHSGGSEGGTLIAGKNLDLTALQIPEIVAKQVTTQFANTEGFIPTDDWPYLYLRRPAIPGLYLGTLVLVVGLVGVLSWVFLRFTSSRRRPSLTWRTPGSMVEGNPKAEIKLKAWGLVPTMGPDFHRDDGRYQAIHFAALGAAFLLIETKSITELSLLFGSTWIVNASVIAGILIMALLANELVSRNVKIPLRWIAVGLFGSLLATYLIRPLTFTGQSFWVKFWFGGGLAALPLFFSGLLFSRSFKIVKQPATALGANLVGAFFGGLLENTAMIVGVRALTWWAVICYGVALWQNIKIKKDVKV